MDARVTITIKDLTEEDIEKHDVLVNASSEEAVLISKSSSYKWMGELVSTGLAIGATYASISEKLPSQIIPGLADGQGALADAPSYFLGHVANRVVNRATASFSTGVERLGMVSGFLLRSFTAVVSTGVAVGVDALFEHNGWYSADPKARNWEKASVAVLGNTLGRLVEKGITKCAQKVTNSDIRVNVSRASSSLFGKSSSRSLRQPLIDDVELGKSKKLTKA